MTPLRYAFIAMSIIITASNFFVQFPINDWLTWGAFPYPISLLVTELTNRQYGPRKALKVVYLGFFIAVVLSIWLATPKIAFASGLAFLSSQMLDIYIFDALRAARWWQGPFIASFAASIVDASIFWTIAFWGEDAPVLTWAIGDTSIKLLIDIALLIPFRLALKL